MLRVQATVTIGNRHLLDFRTRQFLLLNTNMNMVIKYFNKNSIYFDLRTVRAEALMPINLQVFHLEEKAGFIIH